MYKIDNNNMLLQEDVLKPNTITSNLLTFL